MDNSAASNPSLYGGKNKMERQCLCVRVSEACKMLSIGRTTLFSLDIPYVKLNSVRLYKVADLEAYLEAHTVTKEGV